MSKPSEKAMQLANTLLEGLANGIVSRQAFSECLDNFARVYTAAALEAKHRETWALAINKLWNEWKEHKDDPEMIEDLFVYHLNRCPPIEATKDK